MNAPVPCPRCGYDLAGLTGKCPECGRPVHRFTERAHEVMTVANRVALRLPHRGAHRGRICPCHVLLAIATGPDGVGKAALRASGVDPPALAVRIEGFFRGGAGTTDDSRRLPLSVRTAEVADAAVEEAFRLGQDWVGTEHLLLALLTCSDLDCQRALAGSRLSVETCRAFIVENAKGQG